VIAWIRGEDNRDAEPRSLGDFLRRVRALREFSRAGVVAQDEISDVTLIDVVVQGVGVERGDLHQPGLLLERHPGEEVGDARADRQSPVLVGVQRAVPVQIPEREGAGLQQGADAAVDAHEMRAVSGFNRAFGGRAASSRAAP